MPARAHQAKGAPQVALEWLRRGLRHGRFAPGQRLREVDLLDEAPVSKAPLREALQILAREGLIEIEPRRGFVVRKYTRAEIAHAFVVLEPLGRLSALGAAQAVSEGASVDGLRAAVARADRAVEKRDLFDFADAADDWRGELETLAGNLFLQAAINQVRGPLFRLQARGLIERDDLPRAVQAYRDITAAVAAGDGETAADFVAEHVRQIGARISDLPDDYFARPHGAGAGSEPGEP
ncbi:MAG: GntR family transcriptional regulator [Caulobacterales bacterium]|nr:GntR family transcriptional regulator [Caulobacterales bacterium]